MSSAGQPVALGVQEIADIAVDCNVPPDSYFELWFKAADWQKAIVDHFGGARDRTLLDVGCGAMRLGSQLLPEIGAGHYIGVDPIAEYVQVGRAIAERLGCADKATLRVSEDFEFPEDRPVDLGIAQSVFTHMTPERCLVCLTRLERVMKPGAAFVFTFIPDRNERSKGYFYLRRYAFISKRPPGADLFQGFAAERGHSFEVFEGIPHPSGQRVGVIRFGAPGAAREAR